MSLERAPSHALRAGPTELREFLTSLPRVSAEKGAQVQFFVGRASHASAWGELGFFFFEGWRSLAPVRNVRNGPGGAYGG